MSLWCSLLCGAQLSNAIVTETLASQPVFDYKYDVPVMSNWYLGVKLTPTHATFEIRFCLVFEIRFRPIKTDITHHNSDFRKAGESDFRISKSDFSRTAKPNFTNHKKVKSDFPNGKIRLQFYK